MTFTALIVLFALAGILFLWAAARRVAQRRLLGGALHGATALVLILLSVAAALLAVNLRAYQRLSYEQPAGELQFARIGDRQFNAVLTYPGGERADFALRGDEWQIDARVLKWHALANIVGFDAAYRLERIGGRYTRVEDERAQARTVYDLNAPRRIDPWELAHRYHSWVPWVDALYGSATFLPMADGALYEIKVSQTGLIARPLNQAARDAVGSWH
jgi:membrane protein implicated in regulation of membrane protease activity